MTSTGAAGQAAASKQKQRRMIPKSGNRFPEKIMRKK
jgi:hypothetical protein